MKVPRAWAAAGFAAGVVSSASPAVAGDPWADKVVWYEAGIGAAPGYDDPLAALGEPSRFTGASLGFPGAVTPFNPAFEPTQIVSIGAGGSLVVKFDEPIFNNPLNPFGIDLLVFSNAGYIDTAYPGGVVGGLFSAGGEVWVSANGIDWKLAPGPAAGHFPTLGYLDLGGPYQTTPGLVLSDFTLPVDPGLDPLGMSFGELVGAYGGSGGGTGVDIGALGLAAIQYVKITVAAGAPGPVGIDGFAAVPAPGSAAVLAALAWAARRRRERPGRGS